MTRAAYINAINYLSGVSEEDISQTLEHNGGVGRSEDGKNTDHNKSTMRI